MAVVQSFDLTGRRALVTLKISNEEYNILKPENHHLLCLPIGEKTLNNSLTIGKLGNSYRIMLPKKLLKQYEIEEEELPHKAIAGVFEVNKEKFLVVRLGESGIGKPKFKE